MRENNGTILKILKFYFDLVEKYKQRCLKNESTTRKQVDITKYENDLQKKEKKVKSWAYGNSQNVINN